MESSFRPKLLRKAYWNWALIVFLVFFAGLGWADRYAINAPIGADTRLLCRFSIDDGETLDKSWSIGIALNARSDAQVVRLRIPHLVYGGLWFAVQFAPDQRPFTSFQLGPILVTDSLGIVVHGFDPTQYTNSTSIFRVGSAGNVVSFVAMPPGTVAAFISSSDPSFKLADRFDLHEPIAARLLMGALGVLWFTLVWTLGHLAWRRLGGFDLRRAWIALWRNHWTIFTYGISLATMAFVIGHFSFAMSWEPFSEQFNYVAQALINGHLDVPRRVFGGEAILHGGREYVYFGLWPALFRLLILPLFQLDRFIAQPIFILLSAGYLALVVATVRELAPKVTPGADADMIDRATAFAIVGTSVATGLLVFVGRSYIYHEAIYWSLLGETGAIYCLVRILNRGELPAGFGFAAATAVAGLSRFSSITGIGLMLGATGCFVLLSRRDLLANGNWKRAFRLEDPRLRALFVGALGVCLTLACLCAINFIRFQNFFAFLPIEWHYGYPIERIAHSGGGTIHISNIPDRLYQYFGQIFPPFTLSFPYVDFNSTTNDSAISDIIEPYLGVVPLLFGPILLFLCATSSRFARSLLSSFGLIALVAASEFLPALMFIGVTFRYSLELVPAMLLPTAIAALLIARMARRRILAVWGLGFACLFQFAAALRFQGQYVWGISPQFTRWYFMEADKSLDDLYASGVGTPSTIAAMNLDGPNLAYRFLTNPHDSMRTQVVNAAGELFVENEPTGYRLPISLGRCPLSPRALYYFQDIPVSDLPWTALPMATSAPCKTLSAVEDSQMVGVDVAWLTRPMTRPTDPQAYFARFRNVIAKLCRNGACSADNWAAVSVRIAKGDGFHVTIEAFCTAEFCRIYHYSRTSFLHGVIALTIIPIGADVLSFYHFFPSNLPDALPTQGEFFAIKRQYETEFVSFRLANARISQKAEPIDHTYSHKDRARTD